MDCESVWCVNHSQLLTDTDRYKVHSGCFVEYTRCSVTLQRRVTFANIKCIASIHVAASRCSAANTFAKYMSNLRKLSREGNICTKAVYLRENSKNSTSSQLTSSDKRKSRYQIVVAAA